MGYTSTAQARALHALSGENMRAVHEPTYYTHPPTQPAEALTPLPAQYLVRLPASTFDALVRHEFIERAGEVARTSGEAHGYSYVVITEYWRITEAGRAALASRVASMLGDANAYTVTSMAGGVLVRPAILTGAVHDAKRRTVNHLALVEARARLEHAGYAVLLLPGEHLHVRGIR